MPDIRIDDLLGVRFRDHGRSKSEGFDCYGLAIEVSRRLGHTLDDLWYMKSLPSTFAENAGGVIGGMSGRVAETDGREFGDIIVFSDGKGNMVHIGVMLDRERFIHADIGGVRVTGLDGYHRKDWKVYRWLP